MKIVLCAIVAMFTAFGVYAGGKKDAVSGNNKNVENANVVKRGSSMQYAADGVKLLLRGGNGTFQMYTIDRDGGETPVLSGNDDFTSSYFSLLVGRTEYRLDSSSGVFSECSEAPNGVRMNYRVGKMAELALLFTIMKTGATARDDMIKVTATFTNTSGKQNTFALKAVFDTVLGEKTSAHFSTADRTSINTEMQFYGMEKEKWVLSQGLLCGVQFLLYGGDITEPEFVTLGNKDIVSLPVWIPVAVSSRSFDTMTSYNNSVVAVNWPEIELGDDESGSVIFYIALSANGAIPAGAAYIASIDKNYAREIEQSSTNGGTAAFTTSNAPATSDAAVPRTADATIGDIPDWKLSPEYVQMLIDRIEALDNDDMTIGDDELDYLNSELDEIIRKLEQR